MKTIIDMNKKVYIKPIMETVELGSEVIMLAGSPNGGMNVIDPETGGFFDSSDSSEDIQYSNRNRGTWGNLWSN